MLLRHPRLAPVLTVGLVFGGLLLQAGAQTPAAATGTSGADLAVLKPSPVVTIPNAVVSQPVTFSASGQLEVRAEPVGPKTAAYRVTVRNHSDLPVMWVELRAFRGDRVSLSSRPLGKRNLPLVKGNAEFTTELAAAANGGGPETAQFDRIGVVSLLWQDGLVEGDADAAAEQRRFDEGRAAHLRTLLTVLRGAGNQPMFALKSQIGRMMGSDPETKAASDEIVDDLDAFERGQRSKSGLDFNTWLSGTIAAYQQWLGRIVLPKS